MFSVRNKKIKKKKNSGFSLVEVLLAVVLLGLIAAPTLQMFYSSFVMNSKSSKMLAASDLAHHVSEALSAQTFLDSKSNGGGEYIGLAKYYGYPGIYTEYPATPDYVFGVIKGFSEKTVEGEFDEEGNPKVENSPDYEYGPAGTMSAPSTSNGGQSYHFLFSNVSSNGYNFNVDIEMSNIDAHRDPLSGVVDSGTADADGKITYSINNSYYSVLTNITIYDSKTNDILATTTTQIPNKR